MATGETLMVIGAMVLLSILLLSINGALVSNSEIILEGKVASLAISLGEQVIEEAIPRSSVNFETLFQDYDGMRRYYRYEIPGGGDAADFTVEQLAESDSALADFGVAVTVDPSIGVGLAEMRVAVSSPYLVHDVELAYVFSRQY